LTFYEKRRVLGIRSGRCDSRQSLQGGRGKIAEKTIFLVRAGEAALDDL
jgi:hypothetical protein